MPGGADVGTRAVAPHRSRYGAGAATPATVTKSLRRVTTELPADVPTPVRGGG
jgi:hypothetical protein